MGQRLPERGRGPAAPLADSTPAPRTSAGHCGSCGKILWDLWYCFFSRGWDTPRPVSARAEAGVQAAGCRARGGSRFCLKAAKNWDRGTQWTPHRVS